MKNQPAFDLDARIEPLFDRWPALCGFSVAELRMAQSRPEVVLNDVALLPWADYVPVAELVDDIARKLLEIVDERPETCRLLAGRTFAAAIH